MKLSFQGTSVSCFQHLSPQHSGKEHQPLKTKADVVINKVPELPEAYTNVRPACLPYEEIQYSSNSNAAKPITRVNPVRLEARVTYRIGRGGLTESVDKIVSMRSPTYTGEESSIWSMHYITTALVSIPGSFCCNHQACNGEDLGYNGVLEPWTDSCHCIWLKPHALFKQIQWRWLEYGEDRFDIFGGHHIVMTALWSETWPDPVPLVKVLWHNRVFPS